MMARLILGALLFLVASPAAARIVYCPNDGRPYDTTHGYYVDVPGTPYYVPEHRRPSR